MLMLEIFPSSEIKNASFTILEPVSLELLDLPFPTFLCLEIR